MKNNTFPNIFVYAKKIQLLSNSASILQTLNMAWAFSYYDTSVNVFASVDLNRDKIMDRITHDYNLDSKKTPCFHFFSSKNKGLYGIFFRFSIAKFWMDKRQKIFYARDIKESLYILFLKKILKRSHLFIYEMHDSIYLEYFDLNNIYDEKMKRQESEVLSGADAIVYTGPYLKKIVDDLYRPEVPSIVAPPGYNPAIFKKIEEKAESSSNIKLAYFGTLFPGKGVDVFLDALAILPENFSARIVGGNPVARLEALKKKVIERGLEGRVDFFGQLPPLEIPSALEGVDAIVIPFQSESEFLSPIKLYESLALGLPIIATPMPALVCLSKELKSLVLAKNCSDVALAECIIDLFSDADRIRLLRDVAQKRDGVRTWSERAGFILNFMKSIF